MTQALAELDSLCLRMGLVVNVGKTKFQSRDVTDSVLMLNGQRLERVTNYKYLGMHIGFSSTQSAVNHVKNICKARLKPLKVLANNGCGVGIPVLRTMYISTVRSIIDYATAVLVSLPQNSL